MSYEQYRDILNCLDQPAFLVQNNAIILQNSKSLDAEQALQTLLQDGIPEHVEKIAAERWDFSLRPLGDVILVLAKPCNPPPDTMQSIAKALRNSLAGIYSMVHALLPTLEEQDNPKTRQQTAALNQCLHQLCRLSSNMETVSAEQLIPGMERLDLSEFLEQFYASAAPFCTLLGKQLILQLPDSPICASADRQMLERAMLNLLSNAIRASESESSITIRLYSMNHCAIFAVQNCTDTALSELFDSNGETSAFAGLGLDVVRKIAQLHGGTLMFSPLENGISAMFSISLRRGSNPFRSAQVSYDYAGGFDHMLLELADVLPPAAYQFLHIN